jgi:DNA-directed RNA polymerase specialized sigma subunit
MDLEISLDNFEAVAKTYRPLMLKCISFAFHAHHNHPFLDFDDLYQEALLAVYNSIKNWDPQRGVYFVLYLKQAIQNSLRMYCRQTIPHFYVKTNEKYESGSTKFKWNIVDVNYIEDEKKGKYEP